MQTPWRKFPKARLLLWFVCVICFISLPLRLIRAVTKYIAPPPRFFERKDEWWVDALNAAIYAGIVIACIIYDRKRARLEARAAEGKCLRCGYDLRATPERCPECGKRPPRDRTTA